MQKWALARREIKILAFLSTLSLASAPSSASSPFTESWGKENVSFDDYRLDSKECSMIGYFRDVRKDEPAKRFLRGFRTADDALNRAGDANFSEWVNSILRTQPDRRMKELNAIHTSDVERCLKERGYSKFRLHPSEERLLRRYPMGSDARHRFLHALASRSR